MQELVDLWEDAHNEDAERTPFTVTDDDSAEWVIKKIRELRADTEKWTAFYLEQLEKIRGQNERSESYFTGLLSSYFVQVPKKETKTQAKYPLPSGTLVRKKQQPEITKDDTVLAQYLLDNGLDEYVARTPKPLWANLKKVCITQDDGALVEQSTGLVLKGVKATPRPDKFEVVIP